MSGPGHDERPSATAGQVKVGLTNSATTNAKTLNVKEVLKSVRSTRRANEVDKILSEIDRDGSGTIDVNELLNLVEGVVKGRRERRYMWFVIVSLIVLGAILIGTIIGLTYAVVSALKDTELTGNVMVVKDTNEVVRTGSAEFTVVDGVMVSRGALNATTSASGTAASGAAPPPSALIATASYLGSPLKFSSRVDIRTLMELKYLYIKGVGDTELGVMVTGVARVAQPGSVYGTVVHIISAAGTITLDGTAITFDSEVADIFLKSGFTVARNRRALLGVYEVLGFFNLVKDLAVLNLPESQPKPSLPAGDFLMKIKVYEPCIIPDTPNGDRCIYQLPDPLATTGEEFGSSTEPMGNAPLSPPESEGSSRRSLLPRRRHLHVRTALHRALADGGDFGEDLAGVEIMDGQRYMTHNETSILFKGAMKIVYDYALYPGYQKFELVQAGDKTVYTWQQEILGEGSPNVPVPYYCRNSTMPQLPGNGQALSNDRILSFTYEGVDQMPNEVLARHFKLVIKQRDGSSNVTVDYWDSLTDQIPIAFKFEHPKIGIGRIEVLEFKTLNADSSEVARASDWAQPAEEACKVSKFVPKVTSPFAVRGEVVSENDWWGYGDDSDAAASARRLARQVPQLSEEEARRRLMVWTSLDHVNGTGEWPQWALDAYGGVHPAQSLARGGRSLQQTDCTKKTYSVRASAAVCEIEVNIINSQYLAGSLACSGNVGPIVITGSITGNMCEKTIKGCVNVGVGLKKGNWLVDRLGFDSINLFQVCAGYDAEVGIFYLEATITLWLFLAKAEISASIKFSSCCTWIEEVKVEGFIGVDVGFWDAWYSIGDIKFMSDYYLRGNALDSESETNPNVVNIQSWIHLHDGFWGNWGRVAFCGENRYAMTQDGKGSKDFIGRPAYGFQLRIEDQQGGGDDTALNGLKIICKNDDQITVQEGQWGGGWYGPNYCQGGRYFTGGVVRVERSLGAGDDTAMNSVQFACGYNNRPGKTDDWSNKDVQRATLVEGYWGDWQQWKWCPYNSYICGFQVRFESPQGAGDDTAFNGLKVVCCYWPAASG